jgi:hypothetical protein
MINKKTSIVGCSWAIDTSPHHDIYICESDPVREHAYIQQGKRRKEKSKANVNILLAYTPYYLCAARARCWNQWIPFIIYAIVGEAIWIE